MEKELEESWKIIETTEVNCCETTEEIEKANEILYKLKMEHKIMNASEILEEMEKLQQISILGVCGKNSQSFIEIGKFMNALKTIEKYYKGK